MEEYGNDMKAAMENLSLEKFTCAAFRDIFSEDLRARREKQPAPYGIKAVFPFWKKIPGKC